MDKEEMMEDEMEVLILVDEEGVEHEFELLAEIEIGENAYKVLVPVEPENSDEEEEEIEVIILKVVYDEEGNEFLADIEDDEEWEMVADTWQELVDESEENQ